MNDHSLFAVTGKPVLHSRSPDIFNALFRHDGIDASYSRIAAQDCATALYLFNEVNARGMNVTAPFKEEMLGAVDAAGNEAERIGSVNTVIRKGGHIRGYNTDHRGVVAALRSHASKIRGSRSLVLGGGGAARAAVYGLSTQGSEVTVINRTQSRAVEIAERFGCRAAPLDHLESVLTSSDILVSAISPHIDLIDEEWLQPRLIVCDANYHHSPLLHKAQRRGCTTVGGDEWLLQQALPSYRYFVEVKGDVRVARDALDRAEYAQRAPTAIALIGFMGCGKSAVAPLLAERLGFSCVDSDEEVERRAGESIRDMFRNQGESHFRGVEREVLHDIAAAKKVVIACGGGAVLEEGNRAVLKENALLCWLYVPVEACLVRIDRGTRPLLEGDAPLHSAARLFKERMPYYARSADLIIDGRAPATTVAENIYEEINHTFGAAR